MYLPWVLLGWTLLLGGNPLFEFLGIVVGHIYYFLDHLYPVSSGHRILQTPRILYIFSSSTSFLPPQKYFNDNNNQIIIFKKIDEMYSQMIDQLFMDLLPQICLEDLNNNKKIKDLGIELLAILGVLVKDLEINNSNQLFFFSLSLLK